jgi:plastocyanin
MRSVFFSLCVVAFAVGLASCKSSTSNPAAPTPPANSGNQSQKTITIPASDVYNTTNFSPRTVTVPVGGSVVWMNRDGEKHTTVSDAGLWSQEIAPGADFTRTFATAGKFDFHCAIHPGMTGTITVQ